jgi:hypothetical protein
MSNIYEIENIITKEFQDQIENLTCHTNFPWYFNQTIVKDSKEYKYESNVSGFFHLLYQHRTNQDSLISPWFEEIEPLFEAIQNKIVTDFNTLYRARFNLLQRNLMFKDDYHLPHTDIWTDHLVCIYYVNDCKGDTIVFNETNKEWDPDHQKSLQDNFTVKKRIKPKKGKIVIFPGYYYHTSSYPQNNHRAVINMNFTRS